MKLCTQKICFIYYTWFIFFGHFIRYVWAEFSDAVRGLIFWGESKTWKCSLLFVNLEIIYQVHFSMQHSVNVCLNLNTSYKNVYAFSQSSLYPSGYNHFYHRFPKLQSNTLKLGKIVYWTVCWWCELVILENLDNDEWQKRMSLFFEGVVRGYEYRNTAHGSTRIPQYRIKI